jgi:hypothetical protein
MGRTFKVSLLHSFFLFAGPKKASLSKDKVLEKHLTTVENVALSNGLAPEAIDILLNVALSGKFGRFHLSSVSC